MLWLHDNPSVTAYAVPPPFTQGRLWCGAKSQLAQYTERCINVRFFSVQLPKKSLTSMSKIYLTLLQIKHVNKI